MQYRELHSGETGGLVIRRRGVSGTKRRKEKSTGANICRTPVPLR